MKKFVVFETYQGRGELKITKEPEIREADEVMDVVRDEIIKRNEERDEGELISELDEGLLVVVNCGIVLRLSEDEVNDVKEKERNYQKHNSDEEKLHCFLPPPFIIYLNLTSIIITVFRRPSFLLSFLLLLYINFSLSQDNKNVHHYIIIPNSTHPNFTLR